MFVFTFTVIVNLFSPLSSLSSLSSLSLLQYAAWGVISIGLNLVVIFIYNDIGLLKEVSGRLHVEWWRGGGVEGQHVAGGGVREKGRWAEEWMVYMWREKVEGGAGEWSVDTRGMFLHLSVILPTINSLTSERTLSWSDSRQWQLVEKKWHWMP